MRSCFPPLAEPAKHYDPACRGGSSAIPTILLGTAVPCTRAGAAAHADAMSPYLASRLPGLLHNPPIDPGRADLLARPPPPVRLPHAPATPPQSLPTRSDS